MRAVVQRVRSASVVVLAADRDREVARIDRGLLVFVGVERQDAREDAEYIAGKVRDLRIFEEADETSRLGRSVADVGGSVLVVSQFTLAGDCRKGRRPSFDAAAVPDVARLLYDTVVALLRASGLSVSTGEFQAAMNVTLVNDGPVTLLLDSRRTF